MAEQLERTGVRGVEVVEDHQDRAPGGQIAQERRARPEQPVAFLLRAAPARDAHPPQRRQERGQLRVFRADPGPGAGVMLGQPPVERLREHSVRCVPLRVLAASPQHGRVDGGRPPRGFAHQPGLAHPGLTREQRDQRAVRGEQPRERGVAAPERQRAPGRPQRRGQRGSGHRRRGGGQRRPVQPFGLRPGAYAQLRVEHVAAQVVLVHGPAAQPLAQPGVDEDAVGQLLGRADREDPFGDAHGLGGGAPLQVQFGEPEQQLFAQVSELCAPAVGPGREAVLRQHLAVQQVQRAGQIVPTAGGEGGPARRLGVVGVDPYRRRGEEEERPFGDEVGGGRAWCQLRFQGVAGGVQGDAQTARGGLRVGVGPAEVHGLFAVEAVAGDDGEELHQGAGARPRPALGECGTTVTRGAEPAEKTQAKQRCGGGVACRWLPVLHEGAL